MQISLASIILFVQDVATLKQFYAGIFGLQVVEETNDATWVLLNAGQCSIGLHKVGMGYEANEGNTFKAETNTKLVFDIQDDIFGLREKLLGAGVLLREIKTFPGYGYLLCDAEDPEGNVFQLRQLKKP